DSYTCDLCGKQGKWGDGLNAHHLNSYDWDKQNRTNIDNGITLCKKCHMDFHKKYGYGKNTKEQYSKFKESI
ncbi:HNH endonuclease, partial [Leifsonia sp. SIMBA_070]